MNVKPKIIFVDDEPNVLKGIERQLKGNTEKWHMEFYSDPKEALTRLLKENFDLAVLDVKMPEINGLEILKKIQHSKKEFKPEVVILTGSNEEVLKRKALDMDASDLLHKPVKKEDLLARIKNALRVKSYKDDLKKKNTQLTNELIQSQKMEVIGMMASGVAHDFNNVLHIIMNYSQLMDIRISDDSILKKNIDNILTASKHGQKIIRQMLQFVKKKEEIFEYFDFNKLVDDSVDLLSVALPKEIEIIWRKPEESLIINADYTQIFQIIMNLCLNATNAMDHSGILTIQTNQTRKIPETHFAEKNTNNKEYACIDITDTGQGMSDHIIRDLLDNTIAIKASEKGTGLGLSIVQHIVSMHLGYISINSEKGIGTTFRIYLPLP